MIVSIKPNATKQQITDLQAWLDARDLKTHVNAGEVQTIIGIVGDDKEIRRKVDVDLIEGLEIVSKVTPINDPFKRANRCFHPLDTVVEVGVDGNQPIKIGGGNFRLIAGPCSVESPEQIMSVAQSVKKSGAALLRGGAFKPRTSPYAFQGMRADGIELLLQAKAATGMPIVSEIMNAAHLEHFENVDIVQVGARNMQNFELLKALGEFGKPVLLKRGFANTLEELLMSAEYIMAGGNENVILCERGIRTFETKTRNTLDLSAIPVLKELTHLPIIIDPSHAIGVSRYVKPMALAAVAAGADGLIIEVHNDPANAECDGAQSLTPEAFEDLAKAVERIRGAIG